MKLFFLRILLLFLLQKYVVKSKGMDLHFDTFTDRVRYALRDFTSVGSKSSFNIPVLDDEKLYRMNPQRYSFYMQLLDALQDPKNEVLDKILQVENKTRLAREQMEERLSDLSKNMRYLQLQYRKNGVANYAAEQGKVAQGGGADDTFEKFKIEAETIMQPVYKIRDELEKTKGEVMKIFTDINMGYDQKKEASEKVKRSYEAFQLLYPEQNVARTLSEALEKLNNLKNSIQPKSNDKITEDLLLKYNQNLHSSIITHDNDVMKQIQTLYTSPSIDVIEAEIQRVTKIETANPSQQQEHLRLLGIIKSSFSDFQKEIANLVSENDALLRAQKYVELTIKSISTGLANDKDKINVQMTIRAKNPAIGTSDTVTYSFTPAFTVSDASENHGMVKLDQSVSGTLDVNVFQENKLVLQERTIDLTISKQQSIEPFLKLKFDIEPFIQGDQTLSIGLSSNVINIPVELSPLRVAFKPVTLSVNTNIGSQKPALQINVELSDATANIPNAIKEIQDFLDGTLKPGDAGVPNVPKPNLTANEVTKLSDNELAADFQNEANPQLSLFKKEVASAPFVGGMFMAAQEGGAGEEGSFYQRKLDEFDNIDKSGQNARDKKKSVADVIDEVETHPIFNPKFEQVSTTDRIVFIAMTFIVRGLSLFLIDWAINSHMINSFNRAFLMYMIIYVCIFLVWVLLVNAGEDGKNMFFRMLFYYVNSEVHGMGRIMVHLIVQLMLLPVPFIVKDRVIGRNPTWTYEQRRATFRVLSNFTFFIWILTSVIALRY